MTEARRPLDAETDQLLSGLCRLIDNLVERDRNWTFAEPGSALAEDDKRLPEFEPSTIARSGLIGAVDHLYSASTIMRSGVLPARAIFTLMRGALENASVAVWALAPKGRVERLRRALLWHAANIKFREKALDLASNDPQHSAVRQLETVRQKTKLLELADREGVSTADRTKIDRAQAPGYEAIVKAASEDVQMNEISSQLVWNMCSGMAHGQEWAIHNMSEAVELPGGDHHFIHQTLSVKDDSLLAAVWVAVQMCQEAFDLFETRGGAILKPMST